MIQLKLELQKKEQEQKLVEDIPKEEEKKEEIISKSESKKTIK